MKSLSYKMFPKAKYFEIFYVMKFLEFYCFICKIDSYVKLVQISQQLLTF